MFSSKVVFEELVRRSLRASPFTNPFLAPGGWQEEKFPPVSISLLGKEITPVSVAKDLSVHIDQSLTYNDRVAKTTSNCLFKLKQISRIKHLLDRKSLL